MEVTKGERGTFVLYGGLTVGRVECRRNKERTRLHSPRALSSASCGQPPFNEQQLVASAAG